MSSLPPSTCLQLWSRIGFGNPTARRFFIVLPTRALTLSTSQFVHKKNPDEFLQVSTRGNANSRCWPISGSRITWCATGATGVYLVCAFAALGDLLALFFFCVFFFSFLCSFFLFFFMVWLVLLCTRTRYATKHFTCFTLMNCDCLVFSVCRVVWDHRNCITRMSENGLWVYGCRLVEISRTV